MTSRRPHPSAGGRAREAAEEVGEEAGEVARAAAAGAVSGGGDAPSRAVELLGRVGLVAYGLVHLMVAGLGVRVSAGLRGDVDQVQAVTSVASLGTVGTVVLVASGVGLAAFALWQACAAVAGFRWVTGSERVRKRVGAAAKAVAVTAVAAVVARVLLGGAGGAGRSAPQQLATALLGVSGGRWLLAAVAAVVLVVAGSMVYTGLARSFLGDLVDAVPPTVLRVAAVLGAVGNLARAVALGAVGVLFAVAALHRDPQEVGGLNEALRFVAGGLGITPVLVLSVGLAAFGVYCLVDARYRRA